MKNFIFFSLIINIVLIQSSCRHKSELCGTIKSSATAPYKFNEIGILGPTETAPYIEVQYTISNGNGGNKIETIWVNPPCLIGGYTVICNYDSGYFCTDGQIAGVSPVLKINYNIGGAEYMKITNHSSNRLEYFIAGTQDTLTLSISKDLHIKIPNGITPPSDRTVVIAPFVQYNNAPIYYLLHPNKKPNADLFSSILNKGTYTGEYKILTSQSNPNQIGNLQVSQAWSIENIMELYRAEYKQSQDTLLTLCFDDYIIPQPINRRLSTGETSIALRSLSPFNFPLKQKKFYGFIQANETLQSSDSIPFISHYATTHGLN